jgi:hypothetical protein
MGIQNSFTRQAARRRRVKLEKQKRGLRVGALQEGEASQEITVKSISEGFF